MSGSSLNNKKEHFEFCSAWPNIKNFGNKLNFTSFKILLPYHREPFGLK